MSSSDAFLGTPQGHLGCVSTVKMNLNSSYTITVLEGFKRGAANGKVNQTWDYFQHTWTISPGNAPTALVSGGSIQIKVLGFLTKNAWKDEHAVAALAQGGEQVGTRRGLCLFSHTAESPFRSHVRLNGNILR